MVDLGQSPTFTDSAGRPQTAQGVFGEVNINADTAADAIFTRGMGFTSSATFTPSAAAYLAGNTMDVVKVFENIGPPLGGEVTITNTRLRIDVNAIQAGAAGYTLQLYNAIPPSAFADNVPWDLVAGDRSIFLGSIPLGTPVDFGSTLWVEQIGIAKQITVPTSGVIYGHLVTVGGFIATAAPRIVTLKALSA